MRPASLLLRRLCSRPRDVAVRAAPRPARPRMAARSGLSTPPRRDARAEAAALHAAAEAQYAATAGDTSACTFVCISDTHCQHAKLPQLPPGDVLIHAGDFTKDGTLDEVRDFAAWWHAQPFAQKILIAGNHDRVLEYDPSMDTEEAELLAASVAALSGRGSHYLLDAEVATTRGGYRVWGAPWQPRFWGAFNVRRGPPIAACWARIPDGADVVVTHGPAAGHGDFVPRQRQHVGCEDLLRELVGRVRPAALVCGHIHEDAGVTWHAGGCPTAFINAAVCDLRYLPVQPPVVFTLRRCSSASAAAGERPACSIQVAGHPRCEPPQLTFDAAVPTVFDDDFALPTRGGRQRNEGGGSSSSGEEEPSADGGARPGKLLQQLSWSD